MSFCCSCLSLFLCLAFLATVGGFDYSYGKKYILIPTPMSWKDASGACRELNGTLATVFDVSTLPDLHFEDKWKVWVGVVVNSSLSGPLTWEDGSPVWYPTADLRSRADPDSDQCLTMETLSPYRWGLVNCSQRFPYLCSVDEGVCVYEVTPTSSLVGYNTAKFFEQDREGCRKLCDENKDFTCRSFEYSKWHFCQLSEVNRWMHPAAFAPGDKEMEYWHKNCFTSEVRGEETPNGDNTTDLPTTEAPQTTEAEGMIVCLRLNPNPENDTKAERKDVAELKEMNTKFKERTRFRATTSAVDHRPSATYVGTVAVAVVLTIFGSVIVFDIVTFTASCTDKCRKRRKARKARKYRKKNATLGNSVEVPVDILARSKRLNEMRWPGSPNCDDDTPGPAQDEDWTNFSSPSSEHQQPLSQSIRSSAPTTSLNDVELMLETDASAQQILTYHRRGNSMHQPITERSGISKHVRCFSLPSGKEILDRKWHEPRTVAFQLSDDSGIDYHLSFERDDIFDTTALSHYRNDVITPTQTTGSLDTANKYVMAYGHNFEGRNLY